MSEPELTTAPPPRATASGAGAPASGPGGGSRLLAPKEPIPRRLALALGAGAFALVLALWSVLTYGGIVEPLFLPAPDSVASAGWEMFVHENFLSDVWASFLRILIGFLVASALGIPLGIAIGSFRAVQAFFEPIIAAIRYMPASAFIPLLIIWFGLGESEKVAVIWFGVFFPLTLMVADVSANIPKELVNIAYTLGASRWQVFRRVLLPASWPGVIDTMRIGLGWAWTYLIVAELVAASTGIGHVILQSSRFLDTDKIIAGILTIGVLGLLSDAAFRLAYRLLFPYAERVAR
jgi:NitT/TauT family transport system permease protein